MSSLRGSFFFLITLFLSACASSPPPIDEDKDLPAIPQIDNRELTPVKEPIDEKPVDIDELEMKLNLSSEYDQLGFHEKKFNACLLGYKRRNCVPQFFSMVNFQVVCRDTEGTVETTSYDLTPFSSRDLSLKLGAAKQSSQTDADGYGQMRLISNKSVRGLRFILASGRFSLALRAGDVKKIIVPSDWCAP